MKRIILILVFILAYMGCKLGDDLRTNNFYYSSVSLNKGYEDGYNQVLYFINDSLFFYKYHEGTAAEISCGTYKIQGEFVKLYPFEDNKGKAIYRVYEDSINVGLNKNSVIFNNDTLISRRRKTFGAYKNYPSRDVINELIKGD